MADRVADIERRIGSVRQLSSVVTAMRGLAAARSGEAKQRLPGIAAYAGTIEEAISRVLTLIAAPAPGGHETGRAIVIAACAEQGFVGNFNNRIMERAAAVASGEDVLFVVGSRGVPEAGELGLGPAWTAPMAGHTDQLDALANRLADELFARIATGSIQRIVVVHARPGEGAEGLEVVERELVPLDFSRFAPTRSPVRPVTHLSLPTLLSRLAEEYVFAELCEALTLSFAAENAERMRAMAAARKNVDDRLEDLNRTARQLRQSEITE